MFTSKCETNCIYCYADRSRKDDMSINTIKKIIEQAAQNKVPYIQISGGDIFAYTQWKLVFKELAKYNYKPFLSTKVPLSREDIVFLKSCGFEELQFSLDSLDSKLINEIVKRDAKYIEDIYKMFEYSSALDFGINIKTVLLQQNSNLSNIKKMHSELSKFSCIKSWNLIPAFYSLSKGEMKLDLNLLKSVYTYITTQLFNFSLKYNILEKFIFQSTTQKYESTKIFIEENKTCAANTYSMSILSNGKSTICEMLYYNNIFYIGDINSQSLEEIWNSDKALSLYNHSIDSAIANKKSLCYKCNDLKKCKQSYEKKICYVDVINTSNNKWDYPDPRCPQALDYQILLGCYW